MVEILYYEKSSKNKTIGYVDAKVQIERPCVLILRKIPHLKNENREWFNLPAFMRNESYLKYWEFENSAFNRSLMEALPEKVTAFCNKQSHVMQVSDDEGLPF